jgi:Protein of unknown function (DUF2865)
MGVRYFSTGRGSALSAFARYAAVLTAVMGATLWSGSVFWHAVIDAPVAHTVTSDLPGTTPLTAVAVLESGDDWTQNLRSEKFWAGKKATEAKSYKTAKSDARAAPDFSPRDFSPRDFSQRSGLIKSSVPTPGPDARPQSKGPPSKNERADGSNWYSGDGHHRTVCVRLCDGYFWPISFSTDSDHFDRDKQVCEKSCGGAQTRLFIHDNPGQDIEQMVDLKGNPYTKLRTAFLFRSNFDQACKCNAHPWEQASKDRHRIYALEAEKRKGSQHAAAELTRMKSALIEARKAATVVRTASIETSRTTSVRSDATAVAAKRVEPPVTAVVARHAPLAERLTRDDLAGAMLVDAPAAAVVPLSGRLPQWAQLMPPALPPSLVVASSKEPVTKLPAAPFALPSSAPAIVPASSIALPATQTASASASWVASGANPKSKLGAAAPHNLAITAPPIIAGANEELGIKAPLAVNTAQLEQINVPRKATGDQPKVVQSAPKLKVAAIDPSDVRSEPVRSGTMPRREPRVIERAPDRSPDRAQERAKPEPREERRAAVARPAPAAPRVVERPAPRPAVRVVEAPRAAPQVARARPQQGRSDTWRVTAFESRQ